MSPKPPEFVDSDNNTLLNLPSLLLIIVSPFDIQKRLLREDFGIEHLRWRMDRIKDYFLRIHPEVDNEAWQIFDYGNSIAAQLLVHARQEFESDIQDIHSKLYFHFEKLQFTPQEIEALRPSILAIYRQIVEQPLASIEAQIDNQIVTLANTITLRRLMERTRWSAMDVLKS